MSDYKEIEEKRDKAIAQAEAKVNVAQGETFALLAIAYELALLRKEIDYATEALRGGP